MIDLDYFRDFKINYIANLFFLSIVICRQCLLHFNLTRPIPLVQQLNPHLRWLSQSSQAMEDEAEALSSNPSQPFNESDALDPAIEKKRAAMLERLSNRHQSLAPKSNESDSSFESTSSFLSRFADSKSSIEAQIAQCRLTCHSDSTQLKSNLDKISSSISDLEKLVAENSYFLPSYEVRSSLQTISELKQSIDNLSSDLIPKKKFSFKNKTAKKTSVIDLKKEEEQDKEAVIGINKKMNFTVPHSPGFRNKKGEILVRNFKDSEIGEFTISDLDSCEVRLMGSVRSLFVHKLRNCRVYGGPVIGSILIEGAEGCVFVIASHQIRIHNAKATDFYLRVRSRPIIEDSNGVRFSPYCLSYEGIEGDLKDAHLDEETGNWANVDDFRWLRAIQSPNWSILPVNERIDMVTISDLDSGAQEF